MYYMMDQIVYMLFDGAIYLIIPALYGAWRAWRHRLLNKNKQLAICVVSSVVLFLVSIPVALNNMRLPSVISPLACAVLSYFVCGWVYKLIRKYC